MLERLIVISLCLLATTASLADVAPPDPPTSNSNSHALGLQGAPNFRDIGGYATTDGRHVRSGLVFRSNAINKLTTSDEELVGRLHLQSVVDLRTQEERDAAPSLWLMRPPNVYESPKVSIGPLMNTLLDESTTGEGARQGMRSFYAQMPDQYRAEYSAMARDISHRELPLLVHCTAGKDRTGVAIAVLLSSLGVPRSTVTADYTLTDQLLPAPVLSKQVPGSGEHAQSARARLAELPVDAQAALMKADSAYINSALDSIEHEYGSMDNYLVRGLGLSANELADLKKAMLE